MQKKFNNTMFSCHFLLILPVLRNDLYTDIFTELPEWSNNTEGLSLVPLRCNSKCRWAVVARPVCPVKAITCPAFTLSPA